MHWWTVHKNSAANSNIKFNSLSTSMLSWPVDSTLNSRQILNRRKVNVGSNYALLNFCLHRSSYHSNMAFTNTFAKICHHSLPYDKTHSALLRNQGLHLGQNSLGEPRLNRNDQISHGLKAILIVLAYSVSQPVSNRRIVQRVPRF